MNLTSRPYLYPRITRTAFVPALLPFKTTAQLQAECVTFRALCIKREVNAQWAQQLNEWVREHKAKRERAAA